MKRIAAFLALMMVVGSAYLFAGDSSPKIGVIYLRKVFDTYQKTIDYDKQLNEKAQKIQAKKDALQKEIEKIQASLEVVSKEEKEKKLKELREKQMELRNYMVESMRTINTEREKYMQEILKDIKPIITNYAKENGYDLILNGDMLLYSKDDSDLTEIMVKKLNEEYKKSKK